MRGTKFAASKSLHAAVLTSSSLGNSDVLQTLKQRLECWLLQSPDLRVLYSSQSAVSVVILGGNRPAFINAPFHPFAATNEAAVCSVKRDVAN